MSKVQRGLGKGVGAIFGGVPNADQLRKPVGYINKDVVGTQGSHENTADILRVPVEMIEPNPFQPRLSFDQEALNELASSIRTLGLIQPITVRRSSPGKYQIISGERRYKACRLAGMSTIPAYIRDTDDQGMLEMAIVENVQRENLDPIELALSYQRLIDECNLTQDKLAERVGKNRATVSNTIRLLKLPAKVQHDIKVGLLSMGHAKAILGVDDPEKQEQLCDLVIKDGMSVRELEALVRKMLEEPTTTTAKPAQNRTQELPDDYYKILSHVGRFFSNEISLKRSSSGKGTMTIKFSSDEEVKAFVKALEDKQF
ncbi:MAG: ParB/RepB/Spo0J family partition protein [Bacteroides sp.]|nr:ParB/RepB/Spo0J family partition protein [Bacteroidales bacterium]MDD7489946.1 ParB/RepB/Spo0J family partition protein [Bacteroides sp.]MDY5891220.1 ParB/RepB/Spo0J family partition protein [Candidatus Cryptobacteroides sp.]